MNSEGNCGKVSATSGDTLLTGTRDFCVPGKGQSGKKLTVLQVEAG
jgi:hypothetical protein